MPVTARRTALPSAVRQSSESSPRPLGRSLGKHRKSKQSAAPKAAAAVMSVGLAVSGGAIASVVASPQTASAATTKSTAATKSASAASVRGNKPIATRPLLRPGDRGSAVRYVQYHTGVRLTSANYYGKSTQTAVARFQRSVGLRRSGSMTPQTWASLQYVIKRKATKARTTSTRSTSTGTFRARVLKEAAKLRGTPYRYGGTTTRGFDCSGYTGYVYKKAGKTLPRTSRAQYSATRHVSRAAAKPGDLVFFKSGSGSVYHVGIYAGGNMLWHSSKPGRPVAKAKIWSSRVAFGSK